MSRLIRSRRASVSSRTFASLIFRGSHGDRDVASKHAIEESRIVRVSSRSTSRPVPLPTPAAGSVCNTRTSPSADQPFPTPPG